MRRALLIVAALAVVVYASTPPPARPLPPAPAELAEPVRGVIHVHTRRSDGSGTVEDIARAAARAGLQFVVLTDHGDAMRVPDPPSFHAGVLAVDAVEISTDNGHVIALNMGPSPYPLGGEARDVVEDVTRMGGVSFAAHPGSRKHELRWTDWDVPIHGFEHLNGDSEWRDEGVWTLARVPFAYPVRPAETLALLFDRSDELLRRWDELTRTRQVVALAGADAHGRLGLRAQEPYRGALTVPLPAYEAVFRSASIALPNARMSTDPVAAASTIVDEIRAGRLFSSVDALGSHPRFELAASSGKSRAVSGEVLAVDGPVQIDIRVQAPPDAETVLLRDGARLRTSKGPSLRHEVDPTPAVYRAEVNVAGAPGQPPVPWIVSNPVYVGRRPGAAPAAVARAPVATRTDLYVDGPAPQWTVEHSSQSQGAVDVVKALPGTQLLLRYALSGPPSSHPYAALVVPAGAALAAHDRLTFTAQADKPMRVSVQVRAATSDPAGERWHRSVFVDTKPREISVRFDDMRPRGATSTPKPALDKIGWVLFVVDTVNTRPGTSGQLFLDAIRCER